MGEESEALFVVESCRPQLVAVKDLSTAYLYDNRFEENDRDVRATMKKPFFGGGRVMNDPRAADLSVDIDERSTLTRIPADAIERMEPTELRPERVVDSLGKLFYGIRGPVNRLRRAVYRSTTNA